MNYPSVKDGLPVINILLNLDVDIESAIVKESNNHFYKNESFKILEEELSTIFENELLTFIHKIQKEYSSDIFGFGIKMRIQNNDYFNAVEWENTFSMAQITLDVKCQFKKTGHLAVPNKLLDK